MEECIFGQIKLDNKISSENDWTEKQYDQLKNQIIAYKYLIQNLPVPSETVANIRSYSTTDWEKKRIEKIKKQIKSRIEYVNELKQARENDIDTKIE